MRKKIWDVVIIGSGIVGSMTARMLSRYDLDILVIEKEIDIGMSPSSANSAIIHAGHDPEPGTLKARLNVVGNKLWHDLAPELDIPFRDTGSYVVAFGNRDMTALETLYHRGVANGVPGMRILKRDEFVTKEPLIHPEATGALWTPSAAVIDPFTAVLAAAENAVLNGVTYAFETKFQDFLIENKTLTGVRTSRGVFRTRWVVNAAGLWSDEVMHKAGVRPDFRIVPRKGEYLIFDPSRVSCNNVLFQTPSEQGKGILVSTTTHGNVMIGPNARDTDAKDDTATTTEGLREVLDGARRLVPSLNERDTIAMFAGLRARAYGGSGHDFLIEIPREIRGLVNAAGIESPGFASAPAIALLVTDLLRDAGENLKEKKGWNPVRKAPPVFHRLSHKDKAELISRNPAYGRIICRCEEITEGEVLEAVRGVIPAQSYDGIKRRTWLGTGRCQGGFDYPRVIELLAQELGVPVREVTKKGAGSEIVFRETKDAPAAGENR